MAKTNKNEERIERLLNTLEDFKSRKAYAEMYGLDSAVERLEDRISELQDEIQRLEEEL